MYGEVAQGEADISAASEGEAVVLGARPHHVLQRRQHHHHLISLAADHTLGQQPAPGHMQEGGVSLAEGVLRGEVSSSTGCLGINKNNAQPFLLRLGRSDISLPYAPAGHIV